MIYIISALTNGLLALWLYPIIGAWAFMVCVVVGIFIAIVGGLGR
jgi:type III secretory pathway component EscS